MGTSKKSMKEEVDRLKNRILEFAESEERKAEVANLFAMAEEAADGDLELVAQMLREVLGKGEHILEEGDRKIDAKVALVEATVEGNVEEIRRLLKVSPEPDVGLPSFVYAIVADQPEAFEVYVEHGIDVAKEFDYDAGGGSVLPGVNALILAACMDIMWAVNRLLDLGADPNLETSGGQTALRMAIINGKEEVVDLLFEKIPDFSQPSAGRVMVAAAKAENVALVERCLKAGIPPNETDASGWTALKSAVNHVDIEMAQLLLQHGADCNVADEEGWTPLINAIENRDLDVVNLLLSNGADPNIAPNIEDDEDRQGFSALMRAAHYDEAEILEALIAAGADLEQTDSDGYTAAHYAAMHHHPDCLEILVDSGAAINAISEEGHSPVAMFLISIVNAVEEETEIDQAVALKTLKLLIKRGGNWQECAETIVADVGGVDISMLDVSKSSAMKGGLKKLSKEFDRLS